MLRLDERSLLAGDGFDEVGDVLVYIKRNRLALQSDASLMLLSCLTGG